MISGKGFLWLFCFDKTSCKCLLMLEKLNINRDLNGFNCFNKLM